MPSPAGLVVKKGSKMRSRAVSGIPPPVSAMLMRTPVPACRVVIRIVPLRSARVVETHRRLAAAQRHLANRHAQLDAAVWCIDERLVEYLG